jgi:gentisate 1,2-dioxygenase
MQHHSSRDFAQTQATVTVSVPQKLIHRGVVDSPAVQAFSAERKHAVHVVDLPSRTISMTIGGLEPGQKTSRHRHTYETMIYVIEGEGTTFIEDRAVHWVAGDAIYVPVWAWHHHHNASESARCRYIACENMPLLQNLGHLAIREEER